MLNNHMPKFTELMQLKKKHRNVTVRKIHSLINQNTKSCKHFILLMVINQRTHVWENSFDSYSVNNSSALQKTQLKKKEMIREIFINITSNRVISKRGLVSYTSLFLYNPYAT